VDKDLGLDTLFACGDRSRFSLIASEIQPHLLGMTRPFWKALGASPDCWIGSLGLTARVLPLVGRRGLAIADGSTYLPRRAAENAPRNFELTVRAPPGSAVLVTNVLGGYEHFEVIESRFSGRAVDPIARNDLSSLYRAPAYGPEPGEWHFTISTTNIDGIDVVAPELNARPSSGCFDRQ
jgi:hypothetical protein